MRYIIASILVSASTLGIASAQELEPTRLAEGHPVVPALPGPTVVGWGEVLLDVSTGPDGQVTGIRELRTAAPFGQLLRRAVEQWRFEPARIGEETVESHVLVTAVYRPRVLHNTPTVGTPPADVAPPSDEIPQPLFTPPPAHPPRVIGDGVVVVEVLVGRAGQVTEAKVVSHPTGFDDSALQTARQWRFAAARHDGAAAGAYAYLVFAFREPVVH